MNVSSAVSTFRSRAYPEIDLMWDQVAQHVWDCRKVMLKLLQEPAQYLGHLELLVKIWLHSGSYPS